MLPTNPKNPDGSWNTGAWAFRSAAEEKDFNERVRRLGARATLEAISHEREEAAFGEDERIREAADPTARTTTLKFPDGRVITMRSRETPSGRVVTVDAPLPMTTSRL
jgi:hypothetical protein